MKDRSTRYGDNVKGVLSGWDRIRFSATICINGRHWLERQLLQDGKRCGRGSAACTAALRSVKPAPTGRVTRKSQIFRAHGLVWKVSRTTRDMLTPQGQQIITAILAASAADIQRLMEKTA